MKIKYLMFSIFFTITAISGYCKSLDINQLFKSVSMRETGGKCWLVGSKGERSQYQFMQSTWEMYSNVPFHHASDSQYKSETDRVARAYLRSIIVRLEQEGLPVTVHNVALKWTGGINSRHYNNLKWLYAVDVENLYACK